MTTTDVGRLDAMGPLLLAHGQDGGFSGFSTFGTDWLYLGVPVIVLAGIVGWLIATGPARGGGGLVPEAFARAGAPLTRVTGLPAWCAAGVGMGLWGLIVAVIGFLWDVAWHIDFGRDEFLFTPSHMMILVGLGSILATSLLTIAFATIDRSETGWSWGRLRIPHGALPLGALGMGSLLGFPLDELWHRNYGVDVTMWGPTHLLMISGASFAPLGLWLLLREAGPGAGRPFIARAARVTIATAVVVGLSTFQAEFDFGVPQFQQLYHPVLIAAATGMGLVIARLALGRGGALIAAAGFVAVRGFLALLLGPALGHTPARFPLYLGAAIAVELMALLRPRLAPLPWATATGLVVGTAGLAAEWGWTQVWGRHPWGPSLFPGVAVAVAVAVAASVLGTAMGRILSFRGPGMTAAPIGLAALVLVAGLTLPLPRHDATYEATVSTRPAGAGRVDLTLEIAPRSAAVGADLFEVMSWQGGGLVNTPLLPAGPGLYQAADPVPVGGSWKTLVRLARKDVMVAVPVFMPADPQIGAEEIPVLPARRAEFRRDTELLMREAHEGAAWPAPLAYGSILLIALGWVAALTAAFRRLGGRSRLEGRDQKRERLPIDGEPAHV